MGAPATRRCSRPLPARRPRPGRRPPRGFTLVEIAIVLVIIGLLLGGVLKGQELVNSARTRKIADELIAQRAAVNLFVDRFGALPGDYAQAAVNIPGVTPGSNGNGDGAVGGPGALAEESFAWHHLAAAGFLSNCPQCAATTVASAAAGPSLANSPTNSYGGVSGLSNNGSAMGAPAQNQVDTGGMIPSNVLAEIDRKVDDGAPASGSLRFSIYFAGPAAAGPPGVATCTVAGAATTWAVGAPSLNCGAALLLQ